MRVFFLSLVLLLAPHARAEESGLGLLVMLKVLSYDGAFGEHGSGEFVVLVPSAAAHAPQAEALAKLGAALEVKSIKDRPLRFKVIDADKFDATGASAVLFHAGFPEDKAREVLARAAAAKLYTLSIDPSLVRAQGSLLGIAYPTGKPQPVINVATARKVGATFPPAVLKVSEAVGR